MSAIQKLLTEHLDIWTAADTGPRSGRGRSSGNAGSVYGVKKLRELILELAVRGKLVPQDTGDEPASELLKRIQAEKEKLVKAGKIKKDKPLPPITDEEKPFELPANWEWVKLGDIGVIGSSSRVHQKDWTSSGVPFYRAREIVLLSKNGYVNNELFISEELFRELTITGNIPEPGDIMLTGVGTIGIPYSVKERDKFYFKDASVLIFKNLFKVNINYIYKFLLSPMWRVNIHSESMGTTVHTLTIARANEVFIPLPPLNEQHRIVAKVDELMALCDQLETSHNNASAAHEQLVSQLLAALTQASGTEAFSENWQRIATHFDTLFTTEASINTLKQTLLQLAVMGKLVPQDPNDEPASELLKKIRAEKDRLIKEGKIKKDKPLTEITDEEKPFALPDGWEWARFPELGEFGRGKSKHRPRNDPKLFNPGIFPLVQTGEVARAVTLIEEFHSKYSDIGLAQSKMWPRGTLCITIAANIADSALLGFDACFPDSVVGFSPCEPLNDARYFLYFMKTARENLLKFAPATAQKNINLEILESVLIPVPPLNEIAGIVAKVDELMALCDQLKARLTEASLLQQKLADVLVENAVSANSPVVHAAAI